VECVRVLLVGMTVILRELIAEILGSAPGVEIVGEVPGGERAPAGVRRTRADVVVLGVDETGGPEVVSELLAAHPHLLVIGISPDGRQGSLHELRPHDVPLGELSPEQLVAAVRRVGAA
jgi:DNA-binding NarL/FixJ family response regulator